ncbi:MAG: hypothetical protein CMO44_17000 [Verrucomicrobiales bacterium]|nr:hypothetical protein [Verrucomicrobiales bacterium]|tara:strand:+ start:5603 stop:5788 length:186 start_codon:yes stop_codon:yes gene_type:complete
MVKPNTDFKLTVKELALIEMSLLSFQSTQPNRHKEIQALLAKFYHQKIWYRPKNEEIYVSG